MRFAYKMLQDNHLRILEHTTWLIALTKGKGHTLNVGGLTSRVGRGSTQQDHTLTFTNPHRTPFLVLEVLQVCFRTHTEKNDETETEPSFHVPITIYNLCHFHTPKHRITRSFHRFCHAVVIHGMNCLQCSIHWYISRVFWLEFPNREGCKHLNNYIKPNNLISNSYQPLLESPPYRGGGVCVS